jgi:hypothetical protein
VPELFDGVMADVARAGMKEDAGQFPVPEAVVEAFEPLEFLDHLVGNAPAAADREGPGASRGGGPACPARQSGV